MVFLLAINRILKMRMPVLCSLLLLAPVLSSCGLYVHSERLKTQTEALQTSVKGLNAPQYLAAQQAHLEEASTREDLALTRYLVASRDVSLLNIVKPPAASAAARSAQVRLLSGISFELGLSAGKETLGAAEIKALETAPFRQATLARAIPFYKQQQAKIAQDYTDNGGAGATDCRTVRTVAAVPGDRPAVAAFYQMLRKTCQSWSERETALPDCKVGLTNGDLVTVCDAITSLLADAASDTRKAQYTKAIALLQARVMKEPDPATKEMATALKKVKEAIAGFKTAPTNDDYKKVFEAVELLLGADLTKTLDAVVKKGDEAKLEKISDFMDALLPAIDAVDAFQRPDGDPLDQPSAILIGTAKIRHDLNLVQLEIDERTRKAALLQQEAAALRAQLHFLARAQAALCPPPVDATRCTPAGDRNSQSEALAYYINSFNQGRIPYEVLHFREMQLRRGTLVKKALVTEADYRALIQPAIDQIAAYGAGGVNPEVLGPFLASLPVTGAIIAK